MNDSRLSLLFGQYVIPSVLATLVGGIYFIIDGYFVGNYVSSDALATFSLLWPWMSLLLGAGLMIGVGSGCLLSFYQGRHQYKIGQLILGQTLFITLIVSVVLGAILYFTLPYLIIWQGADQHIYQLAADYFYIMILTCPIGLYSLAVPYLLRNLGAPRLATSYLVLGTILNIVLDYLFIVQFNWGVRGVAVATVISEAIVVLLGLHFLICSKRSPVVMTRLSLVFHWRLIKKVFISGLSSWFAYIYSGVTVLFHNLMLLKYGNIDYVAIYSVIGYLTTLLCLVIEGIAVGIQPICSYFMGKKIYKTVYRTVMMALIWGLFIGGGFTLLIELFPTLFVQFFMHHKAEIIGLSAFPLRVNLSMAFCEAFILIGILFFQSVGQATRAMIITLANLFLQIPLLFLFAYLWGVAGVWFVFPVANVVLMLLVIVFLRWQFNEMTEGHVSVNY